MPEVLTQEEALLATMTMLDGLQAFTSAALEEHATLALDVPPQLSALPDAVTKVAMALRNLQDVITVCRDVATRGNPIGYDLPVPEPTPPPAPEAPPEEEL